MFYYAVDADLYNTKEELLEVEGHEFTPKNSFSDPGWHVDDIANQIFYENDGWEWWKQGDEITIHVWDQDKNYLKAYSVSYDISPDFYSCEKEVK